MNYAYDFCDFGCSHGGSLSFGKSVLGGNQGLGIDIEFDKVRSAKANGHEAIIGSVTNLPFADNTFKFSTIVHTLEHLPSLEYAKDTIKQAIRTSKDYVCIIGPYFDADRYLAEHGLKFYWSDWSGHTLHLTIEQLRDILANEDINDYRVYSRGEFITSSNSPYIHPISSPINQHKWDPDIHPEKPMIEFSMAIPLEFFCIISINSIIETNWVQEISSKSSRKLAQLST